VSKKPFRSFDDIHTKEVAPGFFSKLIHTENNTLNFIEVKAGNTVSLHKHVHEQCSFVIEGEFEMTIEGETRVLRPNTFAVIPPNALHSGTAVTDCKILDVFSPVREDYRRLSEG
jgi:quercetin dioxygenase-like cupin family protein